MRIFEHLRKYKITYYLDAFTIDIRDSNWNTIACYSRERNRWRKLPGRFCKPIALIPDLFDISTVDDLNIDDCLFWINQLAQTLDDCIYAYTKYQIQIEEEDKMLAKACAERRFEEQAKRLEVINEERSKNWLYLMRHSNGLTKIGRSNNPRAREHTLQAEDPRLRLIFKAKDCGHLERELHDRFSSLRKRGEWFDLSEDQVRWIKRYCYEPEPVEVACSE